MELVREVLRHLDLRPGMRLLEVGAGNGTLSIPAARIGAHVLATDPDSAAIARLTDRARAEGLPNLEGRAMDGQALGLDDDTFDVAASVNGVSWFPDLARALAELVRVTRAGGRVAIVTFGRPHGAELIEFFLGALRATAPAFTPSPTEIPALPFPAADPEVMVASLSDAGLRDVEVYPITWDRAIDSAEHVWNLVTARDGGAQLVADLPDELRRDVTQVLDGMLRERSGGVPGAVLHANVNLGIGTA